ncbi:MAG: type II toxin-antitoxin system VapC family toxin [Gemmatimonadota bacterium]
MTPHHQVWRAREQPDFAGPLLLDTHVWFWLLVGDLSRMHPSVGGMLDRAARHGMLYVSDISVWEIARKTVSGRLSLSLPVDIWLERAAQAPGISFLPLDRSVLVLGARLGEMHGDPADRWIVATAKLRQLTLLTADRAVLEFGRREQVTPMGDVRK